MEILTKCDSCIDGIIYADGGFSSTCYNCFGAGYMYKEIIGAILKNKIMENNGYKKSKN